MTTSHSPTAHAAPPVTGPAMRALQVLSGLSVVNLLVQFLTAGTLVGRNGSDALEGVHAGGAIVLHVLTGLATLAAAALAYREAGPRWPAALAGVVFVLTFVQAWFGSGRTLYIHVPGAIVLTVGTVWLLAWSVLGAPRR